MGLDPGDRRTFVDRSGQERAELRLAAQTLCHHHQPSGDSQCRRTPMRLGNHAESEIDTSSHTR
jgi:hypothetical protein